MDGDSDLKDAIEMMGWGDFEIHPASTVMVGSDDGLVECEQPTFIQIKTGFRDRHLAKLKGAKLSVFLCIALHMDGNKVAFPSQATIAKETGYSRVEVSRCVSELEALNMLKVQRDAKQVNVYKVLQMARFGRPRNEKLHAPMRQKLHGTAAKVTCPPDKSYTEEEPIKKNQEEDSAPRRAPDPRSSHPAISAVREVTARFPSKDVYDQLIQAVGDNPDIMRLRECWDAWRIRGFKPTNFAWATEWYITGIPQNGNGNGHEPTRINSNPPLCN